MAYPFPSHAWVQALAAALNSDARYAEIAKGWEGDMIVVVLADGEGSGQETAAAVYLDLWHGECREARMLDPGEELPKAAFILRATLSNIKRIFKGELDPIQAMLTRRLRVEGNMAYMLRNIPTVLEFVRCCLEVPIEEGADAS